MLRPYLTLNISETVRNTDSVTILQLYYGLKHPLLKRVNDLE